MPPSGALVAPELDGDIDNEADSRAPRELSASAGAPGAPGMEAGVQRGRVGVTLLVGAPGSTGRCTSSRAGGYRRMRMMCTNCKQIVCGPYMLDGATCGQEVARARATRAKSRAAARRPRSRDGEGLSGGQ
jgi:hypothetical protein